MHDAVQFLHARWDLRRENARQLVLAGRLRLTESKLCQLRPVHAAVAIQDRATEMAYYFVVDSLSGAHELMGDAISLNEMRAERDQHLADRRFARCNAARESDFQHRFSG